MGGINFERGKGVAETLKIGIKSFINIERIFIKIYGEGGEMADKGSLEIEDGHRFFEKVVNEAKIDWDIIKDRFPENVEGLKNKGFKVQIMFLGPMVEGSRRGSHPAYFKFQVAGRTIHYQGKFYDLPETKRK